jgi:hypothetical protein
VVVAADEQCHVSQVATTDKHSLYQDQLQNKYVFFVFCFAYFYQENTIVMIELSLIHTQKRSN